MPPESFRLPAMGSDLVLQITWPSGPSNTWRAIQNEALHDSEHGKDLRYKLLSEVFPICSSMLKLLETSTRVLAAASKRSGPRFFQLKHQIQDFDFKWPWKTKGESFCRFNPIRLFSCPSWVGN